MANLTGTAQEYYEDVTQPSLIYSAGGVAAASLLGVAMTFIPFQNVPMGNVIRTGTVLGVGAYVFNRSRSETEPMKQAYAMAGGLLFTAGFIQVLGYASNLIESTTGITIPFLGTIGKLLSPAGAISSAENAEMELLPQQGDGMVIGQQTATRNYSDIRNAEDVETQANMEMGGLVYDQDYSGSNVTEPWGFEDMNTDMVNRVPPDNPLDSVLEQAPLGHGVTQNFGAEVSDSTDAIRPHTDTSDFSHKANLMGVRTSDPFGESNPFVESVHPWTPSYQPPVWYAEDEPTIEQTSAVPTPEVGGMHDVLRSYIMPSHTMSTAGNSGHGINAWFGAEHTAETYLSRHVSASEGAGHVIGQ